MAGLVPDLPFAQTIRRANVAAVQDALARKILDPNAPYHPTWTVLQWAVLCTHSCPPGLGSRIPPPHASHYSSARRTIVQLLLEAGAQVWPNWWQDDETNLQPQPLPQKVWDLTDDPRIQHLLFQAAKDQALLQIRHNLPPRRPQQPREPISTKKDSESPISMSTMNEDREGVVVDLFQTGLVAAAALNDVPALHTLLSSRGDGGGVQVDGDGIGDPPLTQACRSGSWEAALVLLQDYGASMSEAALSYVAQQAEAYSVRDAKGRPQPNPAYLFLEAFLQEGGNPFGTSVPFPRSHPGTGQSKTKVPLAVTHPSVRRPLLAAMEDRLRHQRSVIHQDDPACAIAFEAFCACGYLPGLELLLASHQFAIPGNAIQTAVVFGQLEALLLLLRGGALTTHSHHWKDAWYYGPSDYQPPPARIHDCLDLLQFVVEATAEASTLTGLCTNLLHRAGIDRLDLSQVWIEHRLYLSETDPIAAWEAQRS